MDGIQALRIELAEQVLELPVALRSTFPDVGTDFLYNVFHDVMDARLEENKAVGAKKRRVKGVEGGSGVGVDGVEDGGVPVAKRTRSSSCIVEGEEIEDADGDGVRKGDSSGTSTCEKNMLLTDDRVGKVKEDLGKIRSWSATMESCVFQYPKRLEMEVDSSVEGLVRCRVCGKVVAKDASGVHAQHCVGKHHNNTVKTDDTQLPSSQNNNDCTVNGDGSQGDGQSVRNSGGHAMVMSNIAPIHTRGDVAGDAAGTPLSPMLRAASAARQGRSIGVRKRRTSPVEVPSGGGVHPNVQQQYQLPPMREFTVPGVPVHSPVIPQQYSGVVPGVVNPQQITPDQHQAIIEAQRMRHYVQMIQRGVIIRGPDGKPMLNPNMVGNGASHPPHQGQVWYPSAQHHGGGHPMMYQQHPMVPVQHGHQMQPRPPGNPSYPGMPFNHHPHRDQSRQ